VVADRARPAQNAGEREMLTGWLEHHRGILIWKCEDLTAEQLRRRAVPPSTLSLLVCAPLFPVQSGSAVREDRRAERAGCQAWPASARGQRAMRIGCLARRRG
jgi:hypothetical protein